jgi:hypothetical protein
VLSDIDTEALEQTTYTLRTTGADVTPSPTPTKSKNWRNKRRTPLIYVGGSLDTSPGVEGPHSPKGTRFMSLSTAPAPVTTPTGAPLPLVALPQVELLTVNSEDIPMIKDAVGPGVHSQPLRLDIEAGEWIMLATFAPGASVPLHYHTGVAEVSTLAGRWNYLEYPDQPQTAGS